MEKNNNQPPATSVLSPCYMFVCAAPTTHTKQRCEHLKASPSLWAAAAHARWQTDLSTYLFKCALLFCHASYVLHGSSQCALRSQIWCGLVSMPEMTSTARENTWQILPRSKILVLNLLMQTGNDSSETTQVTSDLCVQEGENLISWLLTIFLPF